MWDEQQITYQEDKQREADQEAQQRRRPGKRKRHKSIHGWFNHVRSSLKHSGHDADSHEFWRDADSE